MSVKSLWRAARDIVTYPVRDAIDDYKMCRRESSDVFDAVVGAGMIQTAKNFPTLAVLAATALLASPEKVGECLAIAGASLVVTNILGATTGGRDRTPFLPSLQKPVPAHTPA